MTMTPEKLRALYGEQSPVAAAKVISTFDDHCRAFIKHSTFVVIGTFNGEKLDLSPKGDPAGFVEVESENQLLIPDRPGNRRLDGLMNILQNPNVALIFMIPGVTETLRVNGVAEILDDADICDRFKINGRAPKTVLRVTAREILVHCGKAPIRAGLWQPETWPQTRPVATLFEMVRDHSAMEVASVEQGAVDKSYKKSLY